MSTGNDEFDDISWELLRQKLVRYFSWRRAADPEDLASETLVRVEEKRQAGLYFENLGKYAYGVAGNVLRESRRARPTEELNPDTAAPAGPDPDREVILKCVESCLAELPERDIEIVMAGYGGGKRYESRAEMAKNLGISVEALDFRAFWLRKKKLKPCIQKCRDGDLRIGS